MMIVSNPERFCHLRNHAIIILIFYRFVNLFSTQKPCLRPNFSPMLHSEEWNVLPFGHFHENKLLKTLG